MWGRAFGPSYEHDGSLIIPIALVVGGGGGGRPPTDQEAEGAGFASVIYPLGTYVATQDRVRFVPSFDGTVLIWGALSLLRVLLTRGRAKA